MIRVLFRVRSEVAFPLAERDQHLSNVPRCRRAAVILFVDARNEIEMHYYLRE